MNAYITGIALSPDGTRFAVASSYGLGATQGGPAKYMVGAVEVINLVTGAVRTWTADMQQGHWYQPGQPSWADGDRMIAFTWQQAKSMSNDAMTMEGVRLLDTEAPGDNLADGPMIIPAKAVNGTINSVLITPDGRDVLVATSRDSRGTVVVPISEVPRQAAGQSACSAPRPRAPPRPARACWPKVGKYCRSPQAAGTLVQCIQFGWLDLDTGRFTPLPTTVPTTPGQVVSIVYGVW